MLPAPVPGINNIMEVEEIEDQFPCDRGMNPVIEPVRLPPEQGTKQATVFREPGKVPDDPDQSTRCHGERDHPVLLGIIPPDIVGNRDQPNEDRIINPRSIVLQHFELFIRREEPEVHLVC